MFIKLSNSMDQGKEIYLNVAAISSVTASDRRNDDGSRVYITGEDAPWYVSETVAVVMARIRLAEARDRSLWKEDGEYVEESE